MEILPLELVGEVLSYCDHKDLLSARLTSRAFALAAEAPLYSEISICCFKFSLEKLHAIAGSHLGKYVKCLKIYTNALLPLVDEQQLEARLLDDHYDAHGNVVMSGIHFTSEHLKTAWQTYEALFAEQKALVEGDGRQHLARSLELLPDLLKIEVLSFDIDFYYPLGEFQSLWGKPSLDLVQDMIYVTSKTCRTADNWAIGSTWYALARRQHVQQQPVGSLHIRTAFQEQAFSLECPLIKRESSKLCFNDTLVHVMQNLTTLELTPTISLDDTFGLPSIILPLLFHCDNLRTLDVHLVATVGLGKSSVREAVSLFFSHTPSPWPKLQALNVDAFVTTEDMLTFLRAHPRFTSLASEFLALEDAPALFNAVSNISNLQYIESGGKLRLMWSWRSLTA